MAFKKSLIFLLILISCFFFLFATAKVNYKDKHHVTIANIKVLPPYFTIQKLAYLNEFIEFKFLLKQKNLEILEEKFWDVSNPKNENYGKFLNKKQIDSIIAPSKNDVKVVVDWLLNNNILKKEIIVFSDFIQTRINVEKASKLFKSEFAVYQPEISDKKQRIRIIGDASIPINILNKLDLILGLSDFIQDSKMSENMRRSKKEVYVSQLSITPQVIRNYYGIPDGTIGTNPENLQSIAAFSDYYSAGALEYFGSEYDIKNVRVSNGGSPNCHKENCGQLESDLDIQYMTAIGNNITTLFFESSSDQWVLDWSLSFQLLDPIPKIASISYGWVEIEQCQITNDCDNLGINSTAYIQRTNVEFQKIGLLGVSILCSSGDDGSPSLYSVSGNCPIDGTNNYCPAGGCNHQSSECTTITIINTNYTIPQVCFYPANEMGVACRELIITPEINDALDQISGVNAHCNFEFDFDTNNILHIYSSCPCEDLVPITGNGYKVVGYTFDPSNGSVFNPSFPASSPYVTSVGATEIYPSPNPETVCSIESGSIITSGGGFSTIQPQPQYQKDAVNKYLEQISSSPSTPSFAFNSSNRAYPDIAIVGSRYSIAQSVNVSSDSCPCTIESVDGTSCSSPTLAGMFSLINDKLLNSGKSSLGFLNPLLYQAAVEQPNVFNDIINGNNNCNRYYCCVYGYEAIKGFDPASGLGSIQFANMESYILSQK